jgi:type IV secretion system protein VirB10
VNGNSINSSDGGQGSHNQGSINSNDGGVSSPGATNVNSNSTGQNPYQQAIQSGMQSGLTPDGFEGGSQTGGDTGEGYNRVNSMDDTRSQNTQNRANNADAALAANTEAIEAVSASGSNPSMQSENEKNAFLQNNQTIRHDTLQTGVQNPASPYMLMAGSVIPATLITGINSDLPGQIQALVSQNIYDSSTGNNILIPQGARLIGTYDSQIAYGQSRVLIVWSRVIFPNDQYIDLEGMPGADLSGFAGLTDQVDNHYFRIYGSALLMSLFSAGMQLSQPQSSNAMGAPTSQQIIAGAMGQELGQTSTQMIQKNLNIQPTINIRPGDNFNVLVTRDIPFKGPYRDNTQPKILLSNAT